MMLKRFLVFGHDVFEPSGGWSDFIASCDTLEEARAAIRTHQVPWLSEHYEIVDSTSGTVVLGPEAAP